MSLSGGGCLAFRASSLLTWLALMSYRPWNSLWSPKGFVEIPEPAGPTLENKPRAPHVLLVALLRPCEAIYVGPVLCDHYEVEQIALNQARLVLGPDRVREYLDPRLGDDRGRHLKESRLIVELTGWRLLCQCTLLRLLKGVRKLSPAKPSRVVPSVASRSNRE